MENRVKTQQEIEQEMKELNDQFSAFPKSKRLDGKYTVLVTEE